ncbi:acyl-CoA dehydrogenase [Leptolyngbya sp. FACHB-671]|uniref:acyl-CoA dehydrogenase n=1 Tax=Leptolyngbya sp. FACHB-671 TaxID=2692812 RepID=UPI001688A8CC|nr:acyl-CoA dehydrogenase [Leptolyngbya sp. FACHB-671]MBD2070856.1 acyl-CoA dehydrogenase [Leptolyngbya sp. FACHB-671]
MHPLKQYWLAEELERDLGDPCNPESVMSFKQVIELDELEAFPEAELTWLYNWKLHHYYIPTNCGGEFTSFEEFIAFVRVMSRRDLTTSISFTTLFWSFLTWMAGTDEQKQELAQFMKDMSGAMCLSYSERAHGSDLLAGDVTATKVPGGYLLNGEKWPINRATISGVTFVLAKTDAEAGSRSLSLFMVKKAELDPATYSNLPKIKTHGIRGSDMSGICFDDCFIPEKMRLGKEGVGLELALKGFQITRALCAAFSQGAADTALRTTLKFTLGRQLYGKTVFDIPHPRRTLVDAFLDILICDCANIGAGRGFHVVPEQFSVWSAVVKYFVTVTLEKMVQDVSVVLGARYYMREEHDFGIFQKVMRDNAIISVFDGSSIVNLHSLILQRRHLAKFRARRDAQSMEAIATRLQTTFTLDQPVPQFAPERLELFSRGADDVLQGLEIALEQLQALEPPDLEPEVLEQIEALTHAVLAELNAQDDFLGTAAFEHGHDQSPESFELAKKYCTLHAAAACVHMWLHNRKTLGEFFANGRWLVLSLRRLLVAVNPALDLPPRLDDEPIAQELLKLYAEDRMFSIVPFQLAKSEVQENPIHAITELQLQAQ